MPRSGSCARSRIDAPHRRRWRRVLEPLGEREPQLLHQGAVEADLVAAVAAVRQVVEMRGRAGAELAEAGQPQELAADAAAAHRVVTRAAMVVPTGTRRSTGSRTRSAFSA